MSENAKLSTHVWKSECFQDKWLKAGRFEVTVWKQKFECLKAFTFRELNARKPEFSWKFHDDMNRIMIIIHHYDTYSSLWWLIEWYIENPCSWCFIMIFLCNMTYSARTPLWFCWPRKLSWSRKLSLSRKLLPNFYWKTWKLDSILYWEFFFSG